MQAFLKSGRASALLLGGALVFASLAIGGSDDALSQSAGDLTVSQPVVVELFTSQGCNSCPPADAVLGELAKVDNVIALSMHVDYWDYIGWADPFALPITATRQKGYREHFGRRYIYTPQMVIDGKKEVVGSREGSVLEMVAHAAAEPKPLDVTFDADTGKVVVPAGTAPVQGATVWLAVYDDKHETDIQRGENRGRTIQYSNVVRALKPIATWTGEPLELPLDLAAAAAEGRDGCAIIVQQGETGHVLGALQMELNNS